MYGFFNMLGRIVLMFLIVSAASPVFAENDEPVCVPVSDSDNEANRSEQRLVDDKLKLLASIISDSGSARRIEQSGDSNAMGLLGIARDYHEQASNLNGQGCIREADRKLNEGLRAFEDASRRVVDVRYKSEIAEKEYTYRLDRINSFRDAYLQITAEKGENTAKYLDEARLDKLLTSARAQAQANDFEQANKTIEKAVYMTEVALSLVRDRETLVYELKFDSIEEAYAYEQETNRSYSKLMNIVLQNSSESSPAYAALEELIRRNDRLRENADKKFDEGKTDEALKYLEEGTGHLINALRYTGIGE